MTELVAQPRFKLLERLVYPGLLGLRFWDASAQAQVMDGLRVTARETSGRVEHATRNRSGVWSFPDLRDPRRRSLLVDVLDDLRRFLPVAFELEFPAEDGLFEWPESSVAGPLSPPAFGFVPLFSSPTRPAPGGHLMVRADLWDVDGVRPAAWALLQVKVVGAVGDDLFLGLADERGCAAVSLPVPFIPIDGTRVPLAQRSWRVGVRVSYAPALTTVTRSRTSRAALPRLDRILEQLEREPATVFETLSPIGELASATLRLTEPLMLQTAPQGVDEQLRSLLLVRPAP